MTPIVKPTPHFSTRLSHVSSECRLSPIDSTRLQSSLTRLHRFDPPRRHRCRAEVRRRARQKPSSRPPHAPPSPSRPPLLSRCNELDRHSDCLIALNRLLSFAMFVCHFNYFKHLEISSSLSANVAVKRQLTSFGSSSLVSTAANELASAVDIKMQRASTTATSDGSGTFPLRRDRPRLLHTRTAPVDEEELVPRPFSSPSRRPLESILSKRGSNESRIASNRRLNFDGGVDVSSDRTFVTLHDMSIGLL